MGSYSGKRVLVLGGKPIGSQDIVGYLKEEGACTIVADYLSPLESPAKQMADETWEVSTAEVGIICDKIEQNKVDAVFTGIHEFNIWRTYEVCEKLNLPFYATKEQLIKTSVKSEYKQLFTKFDIPVIEEYPLTAEEFENDIAKVTYPVLIKPVDGSGGYGISVCYDEMELRDGYEKAIRFSKGSNKVIVEKYISANEVTIFYVIQDGKIMLSAMADRYTENGDRYTIPLPVLYTFPSIHLPSYQEKLNGKVIKAFESIGLKNGMVFIQAFVDREGFRLYDIGFRLTGTQEYHILEELCGYNPLKMLVDYSLTGKMGKENIERLVTPSFHGKYACNITFLVNPCLISGFVGLREVESMPGVLKVIKNHQIGDEIPESAKGTLSQVGLRILGVAESREALKALIVKIISTVDIFSETGESVLLPSINPKQL